jgi:hypothetical protein
VGQHTDTVGTGRDIRRGVYAQATVDRITFGVYFFNPDSNARNVIGSVGAQF